MASSICISFSFPRCVWQDEATYPDALAVQVKLVVLAGGDEDADAAGPARHVARETKRAPQKVEPAEPLRRPVILAQQPRCKLRCCAHRGACGVCRAPENSDVPAVGTVTLQGKVGRWHIHGAAATDDARVEDDRRRGGAGRAYLRVEGLGDGLSPFGSET
jgi:hypothetical protein